MWGVGSSSPGSSTQQVEGALSPNPRAPPFPFPPGEIFELKAELNSDKKEKKKEAVKKVIASMTVGKDVRYVAGRCWGCLGQTAPGGCLHSLCAPNFSHCLPEVLGED